MDSGKHAQPVLPLPPAGVKPSVAGRFAAPSALRWPAAGEGSAQGLARGVARLFDSLGFRPLIEMRLASGRRVDIIGVDGRTRFAIAEVKTSREDLRADHKWQDYLAYCDDFYFAVPTGFPITLLPEDAGIVVADRYGGVVLRPGRRRSMAESTRRKQLLLFAQSASQRLYRLLDSSL